MLEPHVAEVAGRRRQYVDTGGGPVTVVMLHGIPTNHYLWHATVERLGSRVRSIAPDLTGFGSEPAPPVSDLSPRQQARDSLAFLDDCNVCRFQLVGHDYGALVACEILSLAPQRVSGLVLTNTSLRLADWSGSGLNPLRLIALPWIGEAAFFCARRWMLRLAFRPYVACQRRLTPELLDAFWRPFEREFSATLLRLFRSDAVDEQAVARWCAALTAYAGPASIIWGGRDPTFRIDRAHDILKLMPQARLVVLRNSNHFVPIDRPGVLARHIDRQRQTI